MQCQHLLLLALMLFASVVHASQGNINAIDGRGGRGRGGRGMGGRGGAMGHRGHGGTRSFGNPSWADDGPTRPRITAAALISSRVDAIESESRYVDRKLLKNAGPESWQYAPAGNLDMDTRRVWMKQSVRRGAFSGPGASAWSTGVDTRFEPHTAN